MSDNDKIESAYPEEDEDAEGTEVNLADDISDSAANRGAREKIRATNSTRAQERMMQSGKNYENAIKDRKEKGHLRILSKSPVQNNPVSNESNV